MSARTHGLPPAPRMPPPISPPMPEAVGWLSELLRIARTWVDGPQKPATAPEPPEPLCTRLGVYLGRDGTPGGLTEPLLREREWAEGTSGTVAAAIPSGTMAEAQVRFGRALTEKIREFARNSPHRTCTLQFINTLRAGLGYPELEPWPNAAVIEYPASLIVAVPPDPEIEDWGLTLPGPPPTRPPEPPPNWRLPVALDHNDPGPIPTERPEPVWRWGRGTVP